MSKEQKFKNTQIVFAVLMIISGIAGTVISMVSQKTLFFETYTENSNIFNLITSVLYLLYLLGFIAKKNNQPPTWLKLIRYMSTCCLVLTFLVVLFILAPTSGGLSGYVVMFFYGSMFFNHFLSPILATISFIFFEPKPVLKKNSVIYAVAPTILYGLITIPLNAFALLDGPYPFLRVRYQSVLASILWIIIIFALNYLIAALVLRLNTRYASKK